MRSPPALPGPQCSAHPTKPRHEPRSSLHPASDRLRHHGNYLPVPPTLRLRLRGEPYPDEAKPLLPTRLAQRYQTRLGHIGNKQQVAEVTEPIATWGRAADLPARPIDPHGDGVVQPQKEDW